VAGDGKVVFSRVRSTAASMSSCVMRRGVVPGCSHTLASSSAVSSTTVAHRARRWLRGATVVADASAGGVSGGDGCGALATAATGSAGRRVGRELL
jgi:hypothetical protein